jgi:hypothetical protein
MGQECHLHDLLGRELVGANNRRVGHIEEFRAERRGGVWISTGVYIGLAGLLERLDVAAKLLFGGKRRGYFARWDQIDVSNPQKPKLTCPVEQLEKI